MRPKSSKGRAKARADTDRCRATAPPDGVMPTD
jgi:hypothetical protein